MEKKWEILGSQIQSSKFEIELIHLLLKNRGIKTKKEIASFLNPSLKDVTVQSVDIDKKQLQLALKRIQKAVKQQEQTVVFGDYDVDGICGSAILWETLTALGANVMPYIPHRMDEGYGLSQKGIDIVLEKYPKTKLIITVDNGIVAHDAVDYAHTKGIEVIITDHHVASSSESKKVPSALAIVHTTKLCGTGVAYLLSQEISDKKPHNDHLALVALATIADCVPLTGANRTLAKYGLELLKKTQRIGLLAIYQEAGIRASEVDVYRVGHVICPRLNAMGRLEYAMDSLRLLCTKDREKAKLLADKLGSTNKQRQGLTQETVQHALLRIRQQTNMKKVLFIADATYQQGVIGLVAGRLVEEFYRPSIVLSIGQQYSKASARSISGFNIIEFIRSASTHLVNAGGHPMAAGFTVETSKITLLQEFLEQKAEKLLTDDHFQRIIRIDCELPLSQVTFRLYDAISKLSPFGIGNPEPSFVSKKVIVEDLRLVGGDKKHLKLVLSAPGCLKMDAIAFGMGHRYSEMKIGKPIDIAYSVAQDSWNGNNRLQLKVKDLKIA